MKQPNQKGIVLVTTLLFLTIISLLAVDIIETHLLETKMSSHYYAKAKAFYLAQQGLQHALAKISHQNNNKHFTGKINIEKKITKNSQVIYIVAVNAKYQKAVSHIQAAYLKDKKQQLQLLWWKRS